MQFWLIGFHFVGKASAFNFFTIFYQMVPLFHFWSIKQILALFPFSASAYYRANWINNAAIIVCVLVLIYCVCVCVFMFLDREKLTNPSTVCTSGVLLASNLCCAKTS